MKPKFVRTSNVTRFLAAIAAVEQRGAQEACLAVITGEAGFGKSRTGAWWAAEAGAAFIRVKAACTPHWILTDIVRALGEQAPARTNEKLFEQAVSALGQLQCPIVLDEVEHAIKRDITVLDTVRDLTDFCEVPLVLMGREFTIGNLRKHRQIFTRVSAIAEFQPATLEDVRLLASEKCEVAVSEDLLAHLHERSEGHVRQIVKGLANIERIGLRARQQRVDRQMVGDTELTAEWTRMRKVAA